MSENIDLINLLAMDVEIAAVAAILAQSKP